MTKHTKGTWYISTNSIDDKMIKIRSTIHKEGEGICLVYPTKEQPYNAILIANAPELLEASINANREFDDPIDAIMAFKKLTEVINKIIL